MRLRIIHSASEFGVVPAVEKEKRLQQWQQFASPGTEIEKVRLLKGVESVESIYDAEIAAPFILEEVCKAQDDGVDGIIISCMGDPALQAAKEIARIPVVGSGLACFATALLLGDKFSIISTIPKSQKKYIRNLRIYKLEDHLASIRSINLPVVEVRNNLDLLRQAMRNEAKLAVEEDGAEVIIPGCSRIFGIAEELSSYLGVPVLDPRATVVRFTEMLVGMSLSHSKKAYPYPPDKRREI